MWVHATLFLGLKYHSETSFTFWILYKKWNKSYAINHSEAQSENEVVLLNSTCQAHVLKHVHFVECLIKQVSLPLSCVTQQLYL